jgi:hypothetical protein
MRPIFSRGNSDDPGMEASEPLQFLWVALSSDGVGIHRWNWGGGGGTYHRVASGEAHGAQVRFGHRNDA